MQRPTYSVPPANSPPLHHPVPQHVSTVPQLRSPPPPSSQNGQQQPGGYGYGQSPPQQGQGAQGSYIHPAFGGFINDPTTQMGFQMGSSAVRAGQEYVEQNINRYVNVSALKHYFNVSNAYVIQKLVIVLFPWRHRPWSRQQARMSENGQTTEFLPPREDINSPGRFTHRTLPERLLTSHKRHVHPHHGLRNIHPPLRPHCGSPWTLRTATSRSHLLQRLRHHPSRACSPLARPLLSQYLLRVADLRSRSILRIQVRRRHRDGGFERGIQRRQRYGRLARVGSVWVYLYGECILFGEFQPMPATLLMHQHLTTITVTELEIRSPSGRQHAWQPQHADHRPWTAKSTNAVPVHLQLRDSVCVHVVVDRVGCQ